MLKVTEAAAKEVNRLMAEQETEESMYLRVGVAGGGCSGFKYTLDLISEKNDGDEMFETAGVNVICDPVSLNYLDGTTLDYKDGMMGKGFTFDNPRSTGSCGCGSSFSV